MDKSTENRMLVHALQYSHDDLWLQEAKRLCGPASIWPAVFKRAHAAGLGPLLYRHLQHVKDDLNIPQNELDVLKGAYLQNLAQNTYQGIELKRILQAFLDTGIEVILLKGAALSEKVYHDPGARISHDLDILVRNKDLDRARDLLCCLGYQSEGTPELQEHYRRQHHHLAPMIHPDKSVVVELHWNVNPRIHVDIDTWWERSIPTKIHDIPVRILCWTDTILHLCLHLFSSGETRTCLRGMVDIYQVLIHANRRIDWALFDDGARRYGVRQEVYAVLQAVKNIMDSRGSKAFWPESLLSNPSLVAQMETIAFCMEKKTSFPGSLVTIQSERKWEKKIALLWSRFFPNSVTMKTLYDLSDSSWKLYFYYLFRPIQLFWRYGKFSRNLFGMK